MSISEIQFIRMLENQASAYFTCMKKKEPINDFIKSIFYLALYFVFITITAIKMIDFSKDDGVLNMILYHDMIA